MSNAKICKADESRNALKIITKSRTQNWIKQFHLIEQVSRCVIISIGINTALWLYSKERYSIITAQYIHDAIHLLTLCCCFQFYLSLAPCEALTQIWQILGKFSYCTNICTRSLPYMLKCQLPIANLQLLCEAKDLITSEYKMLHQIHHLSITFAAWQMQWYTVGRTYLFIHSIVYNIRVNRSCSCAKT